MVLFCFLSLAGYIITDIIINPTQNRQYSVYCKLRSTPLLWTPRCWADWAGVVSRGDCGESFNAEKLLKSLPLLRTLNRDLEGFRYNRS